MDIVELISKIRKRPTLYITEWSISNLKSFLDGYALGKGRGGSELSLSEFQKWIEKKYSVSISQSWAGVIRYHSPDAKAALDKFFELFDEFVEQSKK